MAATLADDTFEYKFPYGNVLTSIKNTEVCSYNIIGSGNGLIPTKRQAIL